MKTCLTSAKLVSQTTSFILDILAASTSRRLSTDCTSFCLAVESFPDEEVPDRYHNIVYEIIMDSVPAFGDTSPGRFCGILSSELILCAIKSAIEQGLVRLNQNGDMTITRVASRERLRLRREEISYLKRMAALVSDPDVYTWKEGAA